MTATSEGSPERAVQVTLSVVSHGQNALTNAFLGDVGKYCAERIALVLTENIPDRTPLATTGLGSEVKVIANASPKGFGANHNAAFLHCRTPYFCVANPDIRLTSDPFPELMLALSDPEVAVTGPLVRDPAGHVEDSARRFPTAASLIRKAFRRTRAPDYPIDQGPIEVDWIAGMFMLFDSAAYRRIGGFDEGYFLYYEDVDICRRLKAVPQRTLYNPRVEVVHDARRSSRRNPRYARHHLASIVRFLTR